MTDSLIVMDGSSGVGNTEFYLKRVFAGDAESLRARLVVALETLNYRVLDEQPLKAKRCARGWGAYFLSADVREYPTKLTIALKPMGATATLVTFDYEVTHPAALSTKGDRQTLRREAEALLALAAERAAPTACMACGATNSSDSRFCRICGALYSSGEPAELEVLRLTAGARAGHQLHVIGMICAFFALVASLLLMLSGMLSGKAGAAKLGVLVLMLGETIALVIMAFGASYLHGTLNPNEDEEAPQRSNARAAGGAYLPTGREPLPPRPERISVTEGTTELLELQPDERTHAAHRRERISTGPIN